MKKRIEIGLALILAIVATVIGGHLWTTNRTLEVTPRDQDFGTIRAGENATRLYKLVNHTNRAIDVFSVGGG